MKAIILKITLFFSLLFCLNSKATIYIVTVGSYNPQLFNDLCIGDTLRFSGDSTNMNVYGTIQGYVYNSQTNTNDNFNVTSTFNYQSTYDHILVAGDSSYYFPNSPTAYGSIYFNCASIGIKPIQLTASASFYPNPFSSYTTLQTKELLTNAVFTVYNMQGQQIKQVKNISGQTITINRDYVPAGLYFVKVTQDSKICAIHKLLIIDN